MTSTLAFFGICLAVLSTPFIWRWRRKRAAGRVLDGLAASENEVLMTEIEQHLRKRSDQ